MDELFTIIGKMYIDILNSQKLIDVLQNKIRSQEETIKQLKAVSDKNDGPGN